MKFKGGVWAGTQRCQLWHHSFSHLPTSSLLWRPRHGTQAVGKEQGSQADERDWYSSHTVPFPAKVNASKMLADGTVKMRLSPSLYQKELRFSKSFLLNWLDECDKMDKSRGPKNALCPRWYGYTYFLSTLSHTCMCLHILNICGCCFLKNCIKQKLRSLKQPLLLQFSFAWGERQDPGWSPELDA